MKNLLIFLLSIISIYSLGQIPLHPTGPFTIASVNSALTGHITSSDAANTYTGLLTGWTSYPSAFDVRFTHGNTGGATFNLNGLGAKTIKKFSGGSLVDLASGDIPDAGIVRFQYDGTYLIVMGGISSGGSGSGTVNSGTANQIAYYAGTGTAVSGTNALPSATTATTQSAGDNSTKVATTAYVDGFVGSTNITTLGTVSTGVWHGSGIGYNYGGTGMSSVSTGDIIIGTTSTSWGPLHIGTNNQVLTSNGTTASWQTPSAGFSDPLTTNGDIIARVSGSTTRLAKGSNNTFLGVNGSGLLSYNSVDLTTGVTGTLPIVNGGTGVTASSGASSVVLRDANQNIVANNSQLGYSTTATAAGTTILTVSSSRDQYFTGTTTQTVLLPVVSTLVLGHTYNFVNNSTGVVTVQSSGANTVQDMAPSSTMIVKCILTTGTTAASWNFNYYPQNPMTATGDIPIGGTVTNGIAAPTRLAASTVNYVLTSNGPGVAPSWQPGGGVSGLTAGRVLLASSSTVIGDDPGLTYSSRTFLMGTASSGTNRMNFGSTNMSILADNSAGEFRYYCNTTYFPTFYSHNAERMRIPTSGNVLIGTTTDNGSKLQVNGSISLSYVAKTATYSVAATDYMINCTANSFTVTLPTAVSIAGRIYVIKNTGSGTITLATTSSQTIDGSAPGTLSAGPTVINLMSDGANWITF